MMKNPRRRSHRSPMSMYTVEITPRGGLGLSLKRRMLIRNTRDIQVLKTYGAAPYAAGLRRLEKQIKEKQTSVNEKIGTFTLAVTPRSSSAFGADTQYRGQGIRYRSCTTTSMGYSSGSATNVRRPSPTSRPVYQNNSR